MRYHRVHLTLTRLVLRAALLLWCVLSLTFALLHLAPGDPAEAAVRLTLPPGGTTLLLRGKDGTTGVGLVEIFELKGSK